MAQDKSIYQRRQTFNQLRTQLDNERSTFKSHWRDLNDYILPRRARFFVSDANKGDRRNLKIIDSTATLAARTLRSGMMGGITSPARPWFRLTIPDAKLAENNEVKLWLHNVTQRMTTIFLRSNLYNVLPIIYGDLGVFGTGAMIMEEDFNNVLRFYPFPIGSYMVANDEKLMVNVFMREFRMTVRQVVNRFGRDPQNPKNIKWDNISSHARSLWNTGNPEAWMDIVHVITPNEKYDPNRLESKYKKYISVYYEQGFAGNNQTGMHNLGVDETKFLSEKGYDFFPVLCPRWEVTGEDVYGTDCPGMTALGDIKQLQSVEKRSLLGIEKMVNPPLIGPTAMRNSKVSVLPGDVTYVDVREGLQGFRSVYDVRFDVQKTEGKQDQTRQRISRVFYEDLFLMLANSDRRQITAREIEERHEEKLLALGPVLEQLNQDLLDPLIDNSFKIMADQGLIPPAPDQIRGSELKVEYISIMAQAQKIVGIGGIDRFVNFAGQIAASAPTVLDKIDGDQLLDIYADLTSIPPGIVRSDEAVAQIRQQRADAQAKEQQQIQQAQNVENAKKLSETKTSGGQSALELIAGGLADAQ